MVRVMEQRNYIDSNVIIKNSGGILLNVDFGDGRRIENVEPHRLFPVTKNNTYITLIDDGGNETAVIRDLGKLPPESRSAVEKSLDEYYLVPKITKIYAINEKYGLIKFKVETDHGKYSFEIRNRQSDIKSNFDNRIIILDSSDNRYEIPDINRLDHKSYKLLSPHL